MSKDDNIQFQGPSQDNKPPIGSGFDSRFSGWDTANIYDYADINHLRKVLQILSTEIDNFLNTLESDLSKFNLKVEEDTKLKEAHTVEWPKELGDPKGYISFIQYNALENVNTRTATYIKKTYEEHMRGPSGSMALDISLILKAIKNETANIEEFLNGNVGDVSDTAEKRILELLQNWTEKAVFYERKIKGIYEKGAPQAQLAPSEVDLLNGGDASKYQALFKVKTNFINNQIAQIIEDIKKSVGGDLSHTYFGKFLGPALQVRLKVIKALDTTQTSNSDYLPKEADLGATNLNANLAVTISDQIKRNDLFNSNMDQFIINITGRDTYVGYINQLQEKGSALKEKFTDVPISDEERTFFNDVIQAAPETGYNFTSPHAALDGVDADDAHKQYILKAGDTVTGDIALEDGIRVDGVDPSAHAHTGSDGSERIHGSDILGGTIPPDAADLSQQPDTPQNFRVLTQNFVNSPSGNVTIEAILGWEGIESNTHEFQITRLT